VTATIEPLGDCALLIQLGERIDAVLNARAIAIAAALRASAVPGLTDVAPAYASVCVRYEPLAWVDAQDARSPYQRLAARISELVDDVAHLSSAENCAEQAAHIEIPVCYGGEFGPDLAEVARFAGLDTDAVIARHCAAEYQVAMLGFAPGFPYLLGLHPTLHAPRRASPRTRVPAGAVAIGGAQTGIYPRELPGGWQIVGRTPLVLFDPALDSPALLAPGRRARFRAIGADEFAAFAR